MDQERFAPGRARAWAVCLALPTAWIVAGLVFPDPITKVMELPVPWASTMAAAFVLHGVRRFLASVSNMESLLLVGLAMVIGSLGVSLASGAGFSLFYGFSSLGLLAAGASAMGQVLALLLRSAVLRIAPSLLILPGLSAPRQGRLP